MILIFEDRDLEIRVTGKVLIEGKDYYLTLSSDDPELVAKEIETSRIKEFLSWHPRNRVGTLRLSQVVGSIVLFGERYDVVSTKLLNKLSGENQFKFLLKEISELCSDLIFSSPSPVDVPYQLDRSQLTTSVYYRFIYFRNLFFYAPKRIRPGYYLEALLKAPHFSQSKIFRNIEISKIKYIKSQTVNKIPTQTRFLSLVPEGHNLHRKEVFKYLPVSKDGQRFFPQKVYSLGNEINFDTPENRFVKLFFEQIAMVAQLVLQKFPENISTKTEARRLLNEVKRYLALPFFREIGKFRYLPVNSSVLNNKSGYKELYGYYFQSRLNPRNLSDHIEAIFQFLDTKNIALLYEYWVFVKFLIELLGKDHIVEYTGAMVEHNSIRLGFVVKSKNVSVYFNKTYSRKNLGSYSLSFRPDIVVEIKEENGLDRRFIFDAKYKIERISEFLEEEVITSDSFKNEDIAKMLCYMESINTVDAAFIIYPGDKFVFYEKESEKRSNVFVDLNGINQLKGVGALPLSPGSSATEANFRNFIQLFKKGIGLE
jgi:hypothetical protein